MQDVISQSSQSRTSQIMALLAAAMCFFAVGYVYFSGSNSALAGFLLLMAAIIYSSMFSWLLLNKNFRPMSTFSLVYLLFGFCIPGLYQVRTGLYFWPSTAISADLEQSAAMIVFISSLAFVLGYVLSVRRTPKEIAPAQTRLNLSNWARAALLASAVSIMVTLYALQKLGPIPFFAPREVAEIYFRTNGISLSQIGLTKTIAQGFAIGSLCLSLFVFFRVRMRTLTTCLAMLVAISSNVIANFPLAIARFYLLAILIIIALFVFRKTTEKFHRLFTISIPLLLFFVFPTLGKFNRYKEVNFSFSDISPTEYLSHGDLDGFQSMMNAVYMVQVEGLNFGKSLLSAIFFFVPRSIWEGKAQPTGAAAAEVANYHYLNISMPLPGEFYVDGGYFFAALGMFIVGYMVAKIDRLASFQDSKTPYAIIAIAFAAIILRGSLLGVIAASACSLGLVALSLTVARVRLRKGRRSAWG